LKKRLTPTQISEIKRLAKAGFAIKGISKNLNISQSTVYYHAKDYCRKMTKLSLNLLKEREKGYVTGLFLGDGSLNRGTKTPRYIVRFALDAKRDQEIATRLVKIFQKAKKKASVFPRENTLTVKVCSRELVKYIQTHVDYKVNEDNQKEKMLLTDKNWSQAFQYGVLAGIIDSDGHVHKHLGTEIKTVNLSIFKGILILLNNLWITPKTKKKEPIEGGYSKKAFYIIYLPSLQMKKHKDEIPSVKIARLLSAQPSF
jgi:DNA-binding transcriptional ArsR family regulator